MEDAVERSISVSVWCPWCEQPRVDRRYPGEMTLMFEPFFSCSWWLPLLGLREVLSNIQRLLCDAVWGNPVLPNECIDTVTILACYVSPWLALMRFILHCFPSFFKHTAPLIDTTIWQCLLTILPLQSWTDFRRFTTFFCQEFDYKALFRANVPSLRSSSSQLTKLQQKTPGRWVILEQCFHLPHITTFNGPRCIFELLTNYNSYLPAPCTCSYLYKVNLIRIFMFQGK